MLDEKELLTAMRCCAYDRVCIGSKCPYFGLSNTCEKVIMADALKYVRKLKDDNKVLRRIVDCAR